MKLQTIIETAIEIGKRTGFITFDQLSELFPKEGSAEDIDALISALSDEGIHVTDEGSQGSNLSCSFCGKAQPDVLQLIAGAHGFICNECVQLCVQIVSTKHPEWLPQHRKFVDGLATRGGESPP